ncbi:MAG: hypothetical protein GY881_08750 [Gammaproteobacteria bacterium]|jgi:hypothetical protein|nr:hypothetical protein [Gammaproteobacteria bacterium]MCP4879627.1 hypothetical protein [Gammaproteobacteria bacterium]MDP6166784.1 hypothetical protein [Gammaproteobacteria bacterium]
MLFNKLAPIAQVHLQDVNQSVHCPLCKQALENNLQQIQPCEHLACVYNQDEADFAFSTKDFSQRLQDQAVDFNELDGYVLAQLGYKDDILALEQTRTGTWERQFVAYHVS